MGILLTIYVSTTQGGQRKQVLPNMGAFQTINQK